MDALDEERYVDRRHSKVTPPNETMDMWTCESERIHLVLRELAPEKTKINN